VLSGRSHRLLLSHQRSRLRVLLSWVQAAKAGVRRQASSSTPAGIVLFMSAFLS
jgi:hypothetical protein